MKVEPKVCRLGYFESAKDRSFSLPYVIHWPIMKTTMWFNIRLDLTSGLMEDTRSNPSQLDDNFCFNHVGEMIKRSCSRY